MFCVSILHFTKHSIDTTERYTKRDFKTKHKWNIDKNNKKTTSNIDWHWPLNAKILYFFFWTKMNGTSLILNDLTHSKFTDKFLRKKIILKKQCQGINQE